MTSLDPSNGDWLLKTQPTMTFSASHHSRLCAQHLLALLNPITTKSSPLRTGIANAPHKLPLPPCQMHLFQVPQNGVSSPTLRRSRRQSSKQAAKLEGTGIKISRKHPLPLAHIKSPLAWYVNMSSTRSRSSAMLMCHNSKT